MTTHSHRDDASGLMSVMARAADVDVWVVGDIMLDEYVTGDVERISPEAPVPVVQVHDVEYRLGGAANVARQIAALGARVRLAGLLGRDAAGARILGMCNDVAVDTRAVQQREERQSSRKLRALARHQQLMRLDFEHAAPCPSEAVRGMIDHLSDAGVPDVIILSDYAKGVLTDELIDALMDTAKTHGARVVVDPKRPDFGAYRGASLITPNLHELEIATGHRFAPDDVPSIGSAAQALARDAGVDALIVTRGERGMIVAPTDAEWVDIPVAGREMFDTTGAGDTVVAVLATALACGASLGEAAHLANIAGGIVVGKVGTVSATPDEIAAALGGERMHKRLQHAALVEQVGRWRAAGQRIVFTNGCFDLLHAGHLALLHKAAACGDKLVIAVNSDASVQRLKGSDRPVIAQHERAAMLAALSCVNAVTIFDEDTPLETLRLIEPDVLVKGQDYNIEQVVGRELVESAGGRVVLVPLLPEKSTTALIERITDRCR